MSDPFQAGAENLGSLASLDSPPDFQYGGTSPVDEVDETGFSNPSPEEPYLHQIKKVGVIGDSKNPVDFTFGGRSYLPDGNVLPEDFVALPESLYASGAVKPGQTMRFVNPATKKVVVAIARTISDDNKVKLAPHTIAELGGVDNLIVDFRPAKNYPVANYSSPYQAKSLPNLEAPDAMASADELAPGETPPTQLADMPAPSGVPVEGIPRNASAIDSESTGPAAGPKVTKKNPDGSWTYESGVTVSKDFIIKPIPGTDDAVVYPRNGGNPYRMQLSAKKGSLESEIEAKRKKYAEKGVTRDTFPAGPAGDAAFEKAGQASMGNFPPGEALIGEEALKGLSPGDAAIVKSISNYDQKPLPLGRNNQKNMFLMEKVREYDPSYDDTQYPAKTATRKDYTSGKSSQNIRSLNTAVAHLDELSKAATGLSNSQLPLYNKIKNMFVKAAGGAAPDRFSAAATAVESELASVFKGAGATDQEIKAWRDRISTSQSPEQIKGVIDEAIGLMGGRLNALKERYREGMGKPADFDILDPKSKDILRKLGHPLDESSPEAPTFEPGKVYRDKQGRTKKYKGGDPSSDTSWE